MMFLVLEHLQYLLNYLLSRKLTLTLGYSLILLYRIFRYVIYSSLVNIYLDISIHYDDF